MAVLILCVSVVGASAEGISTYAYENNIYHLEIGDVYEQPNNAGYSYWRFWDYDGTARYEFLGPSDTVNSATSFAFQQFGVYFSPNNGRNCVIDQGSIIKIRVQSWFFKQLQENLVYPNDVTFTFNGRVFGSTLSTEVCYVNTNSFTNGRGQYVNLGTDGYIWDGITVMLTFTAPADLDALYITCDIGKNAPLSIGQAFGIIGPGGWQNKPSVSPSFRLECLETLPAGPANAGTVDDYTKTEEDLNNSIDSDLTSLPGIFDGFSLSSFSTGLVFWISAFGSFTTKLTWLYDLLMISLSLGLFALLTNIGVTAVTRFRPEKPQKFRQSSYGKHMAEERSARQQLEGQISFGGDDG